MIQISGLKISINAPKEALSEAVRKYLRIKGEFTFKIIKRSLDARKKDNILFVYNVVLSLINEKKLMQLKIKNVTIYNEPVYEVEKAMAVTKVAVVGYGPAGMLASLCLAESGMDVTVFERGEEVDARSKTIDTFFSEKKLNVNSNVQFGEGGAGTWSDGKLTARGKNPRSIKLFSELVEAGAPDDIMYVNNPHVGTDILRDVVKNIRKKYISLGGKIQFNTNVNNLIIKDDEVVGVNVGEDQYYDHVILAIGHSSRDTFRSLHAQGVEIMQKDFAVGFRIEHPQVSINKSQFGKEFNNARLGMAEYKLVNQSNGRGVYTFCMCPGGIVIPAQSTLNTVVVNGMSYHDRALTNANSAVLVTVTKEDLGSDVFSGVEFQEKIEALAFELGGSDYSAPVQTLKGFIDNKTYEIGTVVPSYPIGYKLADLRSVYSDEINEALIQSFKAFDRKLKGFGIDDAILTGVESRSSSPVRIVRDKYTMESNIRNLYPIGEGCGYAGGIVSAAVDGVKVSELIIAKVNEVATELAIQAELAELDE